MSNETNGFIYLASPYSVVNPISRQQASVLRASRYRRVCKKAAQLMKKGELVFCPIAHSHPIEVIGMPGELQSGDFWLRQDFAILEKASKLVVYQMDGWDKSSGVAREIAFAEEKGIPVTYLPDLKEKRKYVEKKYNPRRKGKGFIPNPALKAA